MLYCDKISLATIPDNLRGKKLIYWSAKWWWQQILQEVEHRREHFKNWHAASFCLVDYNSYPFLYQQSIFCSPSQHFLGVYSSSLPFTRILPFTHRPNSCIVVWQQLICWLVLFASLSMLRIGCPWVTKKSKTSSYAELDHPRFKKKATKWIAVLVRNRTRNSQKWFQTKIARNWRFFTSILKPKNFLEMLERFWGQGLQNLASSSFISRNFLSHFTQALKSGWLFFLAFTSHWLGKKRFRAKKWCNSLINHSAVGQSDCKDHLWFQNGCIE